MTAVRAWKNPFRCWSCPLGRREVDGLQRRIFMRTGKTPNTFLERRHEAHVRLEQGIGGREDLPKIMLGAEVRYYEGISQSKELQKLKIEDSNLLLLEMPFIPWSDRMLHELVLAQKQSGLQIVLAHIERYFSFQGWGF